jgi:hypothetical protein
MKGLTLLLLCVFIPFATLANEPDLHVHEDDPTARTMITEPIVIKVERPCDNMTWTPLEKWMAGITTALILVDMSQTFSFTSRGIGERNPLLPRHPTRWQLRGAMIGSIALYWGGTSVLPRPYRTMWQTGYVLGEGYAVYSNHFLVDGGKGSGYKFPW